MTNSRINFILAMLVIGVLFFQYRLWVQSGGVRDLIKLKQQVALQTQENENIKKRNEVLKFQVERIRNERDGVEARARNELGMIKKDETFYQIVK